MPSEGRSHKHHHGANVPKEKPSANEREHRHSHKRVSSVKLPEPTESESHSTSSRRKEAKKPHKTVSNNPVSELFKLFGHPGEFVQFYLVA